ncbi:LPD38 domain-containing protein [Gorillibacterium sp. sgz5001074]|uniref:LPD38 domain-containing protein n=1 Tax=Gorillibacterium sp. sgz5001074 TaxID=3446695 RepID=UPI003F679D66
MPLISAKEYMNNKGGGSGNGTPSSSTSGLVSASEYKKRKQGVKQNVDVLDQEQSDMKQMAQAQRAMDARRAKDEVPSMPGIRDTALYQRAQRNAEDNPPVAGPPSHVKITDLSLAELAKRGFSPLTGLLDGMKSFGDAATDAMSFGITNKLLRSSDEVAEQKDSMAGKAGHLFGEFAPIGGAYKIANWATKPLLKNAPKIVKTLVRGSTAGELYGTAKELADVAIDTRDNGSESLEERAKNIGMDAAMFAGGDAALGLLGAAAKKVAKPIMERVALRNEIQQFIDNLPQAKGQPRDIPDMDYSGMSLTNSGTPGRPMPRPAGTFQEKQVAEAAAGAARKRESYQSEFENAVEEQYGYLKQSMKERGGVDQGGVIRDASGEVVDRFGRTSNNPRWYRDFYSENGRKPTDTELRELARKHVLEGFNDDAGRIPPWKPKELQEIDSELSSIDEALPTVNDVTRSELETAAGTLRGEKERLRSLVPEGVQAIQIKGTQNYAGNQIPFRQAAATQTDRTISRNQVIKNMRKNLGVVIDTGRLTTRSKGVLGQYKVTPEVVRSRMAEDIQVISHEIGHHLDKKFDLQDVRFGTELVRMLNVNRTINIQGYKPSQLHAEGVAEYIRLFLTDPAEARRLAPQFSQYLENTLDQKTMNGLLSTQRDIDTWITQGDYEQAKGLIDFTSGSKKEPFSKSKVYTRFVDDLHPLKLAEMALRGAMQVGSKSIYKMARLSRGIGERAKLAVTRGIYDAQGNKIGKGLREIVEPLEKMGIKEEDFATYLAVKHAVDLKRLGKNVPFTDGHIRAVLARLDTPEVQAVQREIVQFNNHLLDILVDAQILDPMSVTVMRRKYPNYVPFMRYFDDDAELGFKNGGFGAAKAFANITNPVKRMTEEGSFRTIINPMESIVKNTFLVMNAAAKNKVGLQLAELSKINGAGAWVEHVGKGGSSGKEHVVSVFQNGVKQAYKIREPELYNAMLSLDHESANAMIKFLGGAAGMLRAGATLTPEFTIRNAFRDVVGATINSTKYGFNPLDFFKGLYHVIGKTETFDQFISTGGAMSTMQALDREANREALEFVFKMSMKDKAMNIVTSPKELAKLLVGYTPAKTVVRGLRKAAEVSELSTKVGSFNKALKKTGDLEEAAYTARDLMDFNRAGSSVRQANRAIAFLNASIQGTDKMVRAFNENRAGFLVRAFTTLVLPSIGLYAWAHNLPQEKKKIYDNIPQWQKDAFFIIPGPGDEFFRIPKPFEAGMLFATGTERAMRWMMDNDKEAFDRYGWATAEALIPPVLFTAMTPLLEGITNHSFFRDAPIVPQGEQGLEKKDQHGIYTSEIAKLIGEGLSHTPFRDSKFASPRIIDNTIRGYTAGLGQYAVSGADPLIDMAKGSNDPEKPATKWSEDPFFRSFFVNTAGGGQVREEFYNKWEEVSSAKASADRDSKPFNDPNYIRLKNAKAAIDKLNKQYKFIRDSKDMKSDEKRRKMDELDGIMNKIAGQALGK